MPPPTIPYDPDAIFGGDPDEDLYDYSDDDDDLCFGFDRSLPCSPRPLSQDQPTIEGLRAWNEERGLSLWGTTITLLSELDITPSYPLFTPHNLVTLGGSSLFVPPERTDLPSQLPVYDWDSSGPSSCDYAEVEAACCSCEPCSNPSMEDSVIPLYDPPYPLLDPSLDPEEVYHSSLPRDGPLLPYLPSVPPPEIAG